MKFKHELKRVTALLLVMTMLCTLLTGIGVYFKYADEEAQAATLTADGTGGASPAWNSGNFPAYDTTGSKLYYYGKAGTPFYGFLGGTASKYWELEATTNLGSSTWGSVSDGQQILNHANSFATSKMNAGDKAAMKTKNVDTKDCNSSGTGSLTGAYMWAPSGSEYLANKTIGGKVYSNAAGYVWSRSFGYNGPNNGEGRAWHVYGTSGDLDDFDVSCSFAVAPAFQLDLTKVLIVRSASSATASQSLSAYSLPTSNVKFLVNAGSNKTLKVDTLAGKSAKVIAGATYSIPFTGASTATLNGGKNYVSAILYDSAGLVKYYGNLCEVSAASGTANITIPSGLPGTYTLALFEEEKCAANCTDYASEPVYCTLNIGTQNYETGVSSWTYAQPGTVKVGSTINASSIKANVTYFDNSTAVRDVYLVSSADFAATSDKRSIRSASVTVPNGSAAFKVTAVFVPTYTTKAQYWSKEYTLNLDYEKSAAFETSHAANFSVNDVFYPSDFSGTIAWLSGEKNAIAADDIYILPTSVWGSGLTEDQVKALTKEEYAGGKQVKVSVELLAGSPSFGITAVYFPKISGAPAYLSKDFQFASSSLYAIAFEASFKGGKAEYGDLLTDSDFSGKYTTSDGDRSKVEAATKYILPKSQWETLSADVKADENQLKKEKGVNAIVLPTEAELGEAENYDVTVVYYDYSEQHASGGGTNAGDCNYYSCDVAVPMAKLQTTGNLSYTKDGITWYYSLDGENAVNLYTTNEDVSQIIDKNGTLKVPEEVDGHTVKSIGSGAKEYPFIPSCINSFTGIEFSNVTAVNDYAFYANKSFARIDIPASVGVIGNFAFYDCDNITDVKISRADVGVAAFGSCDSIAQLSFTDGGAIGKVAFAECGSLSKVTISGNTDIGQSAFAGDSGINALNLSGLSGGAVRPYAFKDCTGIRDIYVPSGNEVKEFAFAGCHGITNLELDMETVENNSFYDCPNIKKMIFGPNVNTVEYDWGGYSSDAYEDNSSYDNAIDTTIYVKNKDTRFQTFKKNGEYYSSFMGHYKEPGSHKFARNISVIMPKEASTGHDVDAVDDGVLVSAVANYYQTAQDDIASGSDTFKAFYTANGLLDVSFDADEKVDDYTVNLPSKRDGITAYYQGKVYDNAKVDKQKIVVNPTYSDAAVPESSLAGFYFYDADEADAAIRKWIADTDYVYVNKIDGKLAADKEYAYSKYVEYYENGMLTDAELETEIKAMIASIFSDKEKFLAATADVIDNPAVQELPEGSNSYAIQHLKAIYYPNPDTDADPDYHAEEPAYYKTDFDIKVVKYTDEMYFFDQGFTYATVVQEIQKLQEKTEKLQTEVEELEASREEQIKANAELDRKYTEAANELQSYVQTYNQLLNDLQDYMQDTTVDENGYLGTKVVEDEEGNKTEIPVVWIKGRECEYEATGETIEVNGKVYDVYRTAIDIDDDEVIETIKFWSDAGGVHVIEIDGEAADQTFTDSVHLIQRKLMAQMDSLKKNLESVSASIDGLKTSLGIADEEFAGKTNDEKLAIVADRAQALVASQAALKAEIEKNEQSISGYQDAINKIYKQLTGGNLDSNDVDSLAANLSTLLGEIKSVQDNNAALVKRLEELGEEVEEYKSKVSGQGIIISDQSIKITDLKENIAQLEGQIQTLRDILSGQAGTVEDLRNSISAISGDNKEMEEMLKALDGSLASMDAITKEQKNTIDSLSADIEAKKQAIADGLATEAELKETISQASIQMESLKKTNVSQSAIISDLTNQAAGLKATNEEQKEAIERLTGNIAALNAQKEELSKTISSLNGTIADQKADIDALNGTIAAQEEKISQLTSQVNVFRETISSAGIIFGGAEDADDESIKQAVNDFVSSKIENDRIIKAIQDKLGTDKTGDELVALVGKSGSGSTSGSGSSSSGSSSSSSGSSSGSSSSGSSSSGSSGSSGSSDSTESADYKALKATADKLTADNNVMSAQLLKTNSDYNTLAIENRTLTEKVENYQKQLAAKSDMVGKDKLEKQKKKAKKLETKNKKLTRTNSFLVKRLKDSDTSADKWKASAADLSNKNRELSTKVTTLNGQVNSLTEQNASLQRQLNEAVTGADSAPEYTPSPSYGTETGADTPDEPEKKKIKPSSSPAPSIEPVVVSPSPSPSAEPEPIPVLPSEEPENIPDEDRGPNPVINPTPESETPAVPDIAEETENPEASGANEDGGSGVLPLVIGGIAVLGLAGGAFMLLKKKKGASGKASGKASEEEDYGFEVEEDDGDDDFEIEEDEEA